MVEGTRAVKRRRGGNRARGGGICRLNKRLIKRSCHVSRLGGRGSGTGRGRRRRGGRLGNGGTLIERHGARVITSGRGSGGGSG